MTPRHLKIWRNLTIAWRLPFWATRYLPQVVGKWAVVGRMLRHAHRCDRGFVIRPTEGGMRVVCRGCGRAVTRWIAPPVADDRSDTGRLQTSVQVELVPHAGTVACVVGSPVEHAPPHHEGHGPIRTARPMRFRPRRSARWVFTTRVRAVPSNENLRDALPAA